jgi:hypothetical protein
MRNDFSNPIGTHDRSAPFVSDHVNASGFANAAAGSNVEFSRGCSGSLVLLSWMR